MSPARPPATDSSVPRSYYDQNGLRAASEGASERSFTNDTIICSNRSSVQPSSSNTDQWIRIIIRSRTEIQGPHAHDVEKHQGSFFRDQ